MPLLAAGMSLRPDFPKAVANGSQGQIRVLVVAAIRLYRDGLATVLAERDGLDVVGTAADETECRLAVASLQPNVVLLDMTAPASLSTVRALGGTVPVVGLAVPELEREVVACAEAGVAGFVTCNQSLDDVVAVLESVARGEAICSPRMAATLLRRIAHLASERGAVPGGERLTSREAEIVELIDMGCSNKQIAQRLCIEVPTVKNHVHNILEKLHVTSRAEAAALLRSQYATSLARLGGAAAADL